MLPQEGDRLGRKGICGGRLSFKGFVGAGKGTVEYKGCGEREGKGRWLTKPKNIVNGRCDGWGCRRDVRFGGRGFGGSMQEVGWVDGWTCSPRAGMGGMDRFTGWIGTNVSSCRMDLSDG